MVYVYELQTCTRSVSCVFRRMDSSVTVSIYRDHRHVRYETVFVEEEKRPKITK